MVLTANEIDYLLSDRIISGKPIPGYSMYTITLYYLSGSRTIGGHVQGKKSRKQRYYTKNRTVYYKLKNDEGKTLNVYIDDLF